MSRSLGRVNLVFAAGLDAIKNVVIDASLVTADSSGRRRLKAGTILTKSAAASPTGADQLKKYTGTGTIEGILAKDVEFVSELPTMTLPPECFTTAVFSVLLRSLTTASTDLLRQAL